VTTGLEEGISPVEIINQGLIMGMNTIAERFKNNEIFVPEVMLAARSMHAGLDILKPLLAATDHEPLGRIVIGTVKGDQHDIGKNLVAMMLEGAGFEVHDLGSNVPADKFIEAIRQFQPEILAMSALLTTTMPEMAAIIQRLEQEELRKEIKVIIGGAPVSSAYAEKIGADGYAPDAGKAVEVAKELL
jgi:5-methyltetrahydrofolate--homocysteine methyltransferase